VDGRWRQEEISKPPQKLNHSRGFSGNLGKSSISLPLSIPSSWSTPTRAARDRRLGARLMIFASFDLMVTSRRKHAASARFPLSTPLQWPLCQTKTAGFPAELERRCGGLQAHEFATAYFNAITIATTTSTWIAPVFKTTTTVTAILPQGIKDVLEPFFSQKVCIFSIVSSSFTDPFPFFSLQ